MPEYRFDMGDSSTGPIGYVAYVTANSPDEATAKLCGAIDAFDAEFCMSDGVVVRVYLNASAVAVRDAEEDTSDA